MENQTFWLHFWRTFRFFLVIVIISAIIFVSLNAFQYTYPFLIAIVIAFLMNPLVNFFENNIKLPRPFSVFITILLIMAAIIGIIFLLVVELINGFTYLADQIPEHFKTLITYVETFIASQIIPFYHHLTAIISSLDPSQQEEILSQIRSVGTNIANGGAEILKSILEGVPEQLKKLPNFATVVVFSLLGTFFISKDWYKLGMKMKDITPSKVLDSGGSVFKGLQKALFGFVKAQFTLISITAIIVLIGLLILRVDYAVTIAIITGAVDLLPYLGTGLIFIPWIIYMFFTGNYFLTIGLSLLYIVVIIQRQMMEPKVLSTNIGLDPLATLVALFVGYQLFGFLGLIVGPVTLVILNTLHQSGVFKEIWAFILGSSS